MAPDEQQDDRTQSFVALTKGTTVGHYRIIEKIGAGGMGEVYLALDTKLNRKVALKFLSHHLCQDEECRKRFTREAQAAAGLDHPNIAGIYEVGEYQGRPFYSMQVVEGQSLRDVIAGKDLPIERILEIAIQVSEGLQAAHDKGIIHRDIKPSNILLDGHGRVRIVDFGLASVRGSEHLTKTGSTLGTVGYMSPEQVQGNEIDHRSDLFSLGVVLYELITKQNPFKRDSEAATLKAVSDDTPHPVARYRAEVPAGLQAIIDKALEKDVKTRYQHAVGMLSDLMRFKRSLESGQSTVSVASPAGRSMRTWWSAVALTVVAAVIVLIVTKPWLTYMTSDKPDRTMLAVLPFENLGDPEDEYFADGITREISSRLASVRSLGVIAHASAATYKNTDKPLHQIADELGVTYVLDGSIQWDRSGDTDLVRVASQLIKVSDQTQIWASNYERTLTQVFQVQADIATEMARALGIELAVEPSDAFSRVEQVDPAAYSYYLKGRQYFSWTNFGTRRIEVAERMFTRAVELEPDFAEAHAQLGVTHTAFYRLLIDHTPQRLANARASVEKASELGPDLLETHMARGWFYYYGVEQFDSARAAFTRVLDMEPDNSEANSGRARVKRRLGLYDEAIDDLRKSTRFDPRQAIYYHEIAMTLSWSHRKTEAAHYFDRALELEPDNYIAYGGKAYSTLHATGSPRLAREVLYDALEILPRWASLTFAEAEFYFLERQYDSAMALLTGPDDVRYDYTMIDGPDSSSYYWFMGELYNCKGNQERARLYSDSARVVLEAIPHDNTYHYANTQGELGLVYARLGLSQKALEHAKKAVRLMSSDKLAQPTSIYNLAIVYTIVGEPDSALDKIETLLFTPSWVSANWLRLSPLFDPLRDHPRFQALLEKYEDQ